MQQGSSKLGWCIDCGYMLRGLASRCCPECGRGFDARRGSYRTTPPTTVTAVLDGVRRRARSWPVLLATALVFGWAVACAGPLAWLLFLPLIALVIRRRWYVALGYVLLTPLTLSFVAGAVSYWNGSAAIVETGPRSAEDGSIDPLYRCPRESLGSEVSGNEWISQTPNNLAVESLTLLLGPQRGAYRGAYPDRVQALIALAKSKPIEIDDLARDVVYVGSSVYHLRRGVGAQALAISPRVLDASSDSTSNSASDVRPVVSTIESLGPIRATVWGGRCLLIRIPTAPRQGRHDQDACVVLLDTASGRPFAAYGEGNFRRPAPARWEQVSDATP